MECIYLGFGTTIILFGSYKSLNVLTGQQGGGFLGGSATNTMLLEYFFDVFRNNDNKTGCVGCTPYPLPLPKRPLAPGCWYNPPDFRSRKIP